jgi:hypothetical protein
MTIWEWLGNGWALFHLVGIIVGLLVVKALDKRYERRWKK